MCAIYDGMYDNCFLEIIHFKYSSYGVLETLYLENSYDVTKYLLVKISLSLRLLFHVCENFTQKFDTAFPAESIDF